MKFSKSFKVIFGFLFILLIALICSIYHLDFNKYLYSFNNKISSKRAISKKQRVNFYECSGINLIKFKTDDIKNYKLLGVSTDKYNSKYRKFVNNYTCNILKNAKKIYISYETTSVNFKDNRNLVWIYVDGVLLQKILIENGYVDLNYYTNLYYLEDLKKNYIKAKKNKVGIFKNFKEKRYKDDKCTIIFKYGSLKKEFNLQKGSLIDIINNPKKDGYQFVGWMVNDKLYDFSIPIDNDMIFKASFIKVT